MDQPLTTAPSASWQAELDELAERRRLARQMGGAERVGCRHTSGRLTVRERIEQLLDDESIQEIGSIVGKATYDASGWVMTDFIPADGVFGRGPIDCRSVVISGNDFTISGGSPDASIKGKYVMPEQCDNRPLLCAFANMAAPLRTPGQSLFTMRP